jgi:hypothetical protein
MHEAQSQCRGHPKVVLAQLWLLFLLTAAVPPQQRKEKMTNCINMSFFRAPLLVLPSLWGATLSFLALGFNLNLHTFEIPSCEKSSSRS